MRPQAHRPTKQALQWTGDNLGDVESLLDAHVAHASSAGGKLRIIGIGLALDVTLELGDTLIVDQDRLGIVRYSSGVTDKQFVVWSGDNLEEFTQFLQAFKVRMAVAGDALLIHGGTNPIILSRGDRLVKRDGQIVVSIRGKDHH